MDKLRISSETRGLVELGGAGGNPGPQKALVGMLCIRGQPVLDGETLYNNNNNNKPRAGDTAR